MRLDHIQLAMPEGEEDKARSFWRELLGMEEETKPAPLDARGGCWFRKGGVVIHVGVDERFSPQTKAHPAFIVPNIQGLESILRAGGLSTRWDDSLPDRSRFYSADPFGNRLEFIQEGDGFTQR